jgi:S-adenosylmethionine:tRNA ribosyltransferase-isomerase
VKFNNDIPANDIQVISQWESYEMEQHLPVTNALNNILQWMDQHKRDTILARTSIIIAPGYKARMIDALVTNFHQPRSTLLLLVAALIGNDWKKVYDYAMENGFRFLSYGDGSLLWRESPSF